MPAMLQQITTTGYGYVAPTLDKARNYVPLLDSTVTWSVQRIEPYASPLIQKVDGYIDAGYAVVERRAAPVVEKISSVRSSVYEKASPVVDKVLDLKTSANDRAQKIMNENKIVLRIHHTSLSLVDCTESLIDRFLPLPAEEKKESKDGEEGEETTVATQGLIPRTIALPFRIPARTIHIVVFKMNGVTDRIVVKAQWVLQLTKDQKCKLSAHIADRSQQVMDRVSTSSAVVTLKKGKSNASRKLQVGRDSLEAGQRAVAVRFYIAKDFTIEKVDQLQCLAIAAAKSTTQVAYTVTKRVAGDDRATMICTKISEKVPRVVSIIFPEAQASTGSLELTSPAPVPHAAAAGTGDTGAAVQAVEPLSSTIVPPMPGVEDSKHDVKKLSSVKENQKKNE